MKLFLYSVLICLGSMVCESAVFSARTRIELAKYKSVDKMRNQQLENDDCELRMFVTVDNPVVLRELESNGAHVCYSFGNMYVGEKMYTDFITLTNQGKNGLKITGFDFPEGVMVGFVEQTTSERGSGFYTIKVRLATEFTKLDHVYIIENYFKAEQDSLMARTHVMDEQN